MNKTFINQMIKLATAFMLVLFLLLSFQIQSGRAGTSHQTIPTAPPTTVEIPTNPPAVTATRPPATIVIPTVSSTKPPTYPSQTAIYTQPTQLPASQTPSSTSSPTAETIPSAVPTATSLLNPGTIPILTVTLSSTDKAQISLTSASILTATVSSTTKTPGSRGIIYFILAGGLVIIFIVVTVWFVKSRQK